MPIQLLRQRQHHGAGPEPGGASATVHGAHHPVPAALGDPRPGDGAAGG